MCEKANKTKQFPLFLWRTRPEKTGLVGLIAVQKKEASRCIDNNSLKSVKIRQRKQSGITELVLELKEEEEAKLVLLTKKNRHKILHFIINDKVYYSPKVQETITGGSVALSFPYNTGKNEIRLIETLLKFPELSTELIFTEIK